MLVPVRVPRVYEQIVARIERAICDGHLQHGDKLPPERQLTQDFRASRVAVREALRTLELRGLVEVRQGAAGGYFIRDLDAGPVSRDLATLLRVGRLTRAHVVEARTSIESELARLAALRASDADLKTLRAVLEEAEAPVASRSLRAIEASVHRAIAEAAHAPVLALLAHALGALDPDGAVTADGEDGATEAAHQEIVAAITTRQPALAQAAMATHVADAERRRGRTDALSEAG
jgi:DNA-binding FadR family transcriptional regulator